MQREDLWTFPLPEIRGIPQAPVKRQVTSDDSEGSDNGGDNGSWVTSLSQPGRVTIGADGNIQIGQSSSKSSSTQQQQREDGHDDLPVVSGSISGNAVDISSLPNAAAADRQGNQAQQKQKRIEQLARNGGNHTTTISTIRPPLHLQVYWSQDRYAVTLRVGFPTNRFPSCTIRVKVVGALKYEDRHSAVGSGSMVADHINSNQNDDDNPSYGSVTIVSESGNGQETVLFTGLLPRPIHLNQDEDEVEYEIENSEIPIDDNTMKDVCCDRFVSITMPKAVPMHGLVLWWECPTIGFPKIDVSSIQDRKVSSNVVGSGAKIGNSNDDKINNIAKKEAFQKAWDEAHEMFREKMKKKEKQAI